MKPAVPWLRKRQVFGGRPTDHRLVPFVRHEFLSQNRGTILRNLLGRIAALGFAFLVWSLPAPAEELGVIPTHVIYPGETINAESLQMARVRKGKPTATAFAHKTEELVGKVAKRTLLPGRFVPLAAVRDAFLVNQGASVQAILVQGGMTISATAIVLESGSAGDVVKVRNPDSGAIFSGTVMADGTIRVGTT